ncbi:hypothetical protein [Herbaspirillum rubrisubalbicans]|uniref:hypothetical protein n=2 Tax=Herbaspirillum rubrisubalbicans TaxID=80842 RepID=UPI0020D07CF4|nr:hypothetical protein [Herbaspirillum rubrisubalbicans]
MMNVTSPPHPAEDYEFPSQLPTQAQPEVATPEPSEASTCNTMQQVNKNQGKGAVLRQLAGALPTIHGASDYAVNTTANDVSAIKALMSELAEKKERNPSMRVALVSGGSTAGFAAALTLKNSGFHVIVAEKRTAYTRQNTFVLKEEALFTLAKLAPEGDLLRHLIEHKLIDINRNNIGSEEGIFATNQGRVIKSANSAFRFVKWLTNNDGIHTSAQIPVRLGKNREKTDYLDLQTSTKTRQTEPMAYMNLEWPQGEPVAAVDARDWQYPNLSTISAHNVALCQIRNLEKGLNQYCLTQENIDVISAEVSLLTSMGPSTDYAARLTVGDNDEKEDIDPAIKFDLIVVAEGANSKNASLVSEQTISPTVESWYQANYTGPENTAPGLFGVMFDKEKKQLTAIHHLHRQEGALVNMSLGIEPDKPFDAAAISNAMSAAQLMCEVGGSDTRISDETIEFSSQRIDVKMKRADNTMRSNVVLVGDSAGSGSPVGALGGSLALAAYPQILENLVNHLNTSATREASEQAYREQSARAINIRHGLPSDTMTKLGYYSEEVNRQRIQNDALALFPDVQDAQKKLRQPSSLNDA